MNKLQLALLRYELRKLQGWADLVAAVRRVEPKPEPEEVPERVKATRDWGIGNGE